MADYSSMKVPELKKLLQEKSLPVTGNKADLIARLQEDDKKSAPAAAAEDEIDYSDDEPAPAAKPAETAKPAPAAAAAPAPAPAPATEAKAEAAPTETAATAEVPAEKAEEPKEDFALHLTATVASEEARKRAERAKRFGLVEEDEEAKAKAERAKRFGIDDKELGGLDSALPERPLKRGRGAAVEDRNAKRQSVERQTGRREGRGRGAGRRGGGGGGGRGPREGGDGAAKKSVAVDPAEKARLEARAKRFAA